MAARQSAMRPGGGGARFAQFKLVLLGMSLHVCAAHAIVRMLTVCLQGSRLWARVRSCCDSSRYAWPYIVLQHHTTADLSADCPAIGSI